MRGGTSQRQVNTIHSYLLLCFWVHSWRPSLAPDCSDSGNPAASLLSCTCRETEISKDGVSTTYTQGHVSKLGPTCESQIHGINCHADDFGEHRPHAWNTNLWPSWHKGPRNRKELSHVVGNYEALIKAAGKINSGPTGEYAQSFTMPHSTYLALSFNDYDRHRSGRPAVFGWEGFITIP